MWLALHVPRVLMAFVMFIATIQGALSGAAAGVMSGSPGHQAR
jgi:hypothetical protein